MQVTLSVRIATVCACLIAGVPFATAQTMIPSRVTLDDPAIGDQDDMCIWVHPTDRSLSTIITSDKASNKLFVYDLQGTTLQVVPIAGQPGNIDIRYNIPLAGTPVDLVAFNDRQHNTIQVFRVDRVARTLARVDNGAIATLSNYGFSLFQSPVTHKLYGFTTSTSGVIGHYALYDSLGQFAGRPVRSWDIGGQTEGATCDDETGFAYFAEENVGLWKIGAEPGDPTTGTKIAAVGDASGLTADCEGVAIYYAAGGTGYIILSSQGSDSYKVYRRQAPHAYVMSFKITGVTQTDGLDVTNVNLGPAFPSGIFTAHSNTQATKTVEVGAYEDIGLAIDTGYWDPRHDPNTAVQFSLVSMESQPDRVWLEWFGESVAGLVATVYRRTSDTPWLSLGYASANGSGHIAFEDTHVRPGTRYAYRLGLVDVEGEQFVGETWVDVPTAYSLALRGASPNPIAGDFSVAFALADAKPATLEIFDLSGRRTWAQRVDALGPGSHSIGVRRASLAPGTYVIRLAQGERMLARRAVVIH